LPVFTQSWFIYSINGSIEMSGRRPLSRAHRGAESGAESSVVAAGQSQQANRWVEPHMSRQQVGSAKCVGEHIRPVYLSGTAPGDAL
jgi:hypothetical protein